MSYSRIHPTGARPEAIGGRDVQAVPWTAGRRRAGMHSTLHDAGGYAALGARARVEAHPTRAAAAVGAGRGAGAPPDDEKRKMDPRASCPRTAI